MYLWRNEHVQHEGAARVPTKDDIALVVQGEHGHVTGVGHILLQTRGSKISISWHNLSWGTYSCRRWV